MAAIDALTNLVKASSSLNQNMASSTINMNKFAEAAKMATSFLRSMSDPLEVAKNTVGFIYQQLDDMRSWLDDLFIVSATVFASQYRDALWDIRKEVGKTFGPLEHMVVTMQAKFAVDDDLIREAVQPLAEINLPLKDMEKWVDLSVKMHKVYGMSAQEFSTIATSLITFNVSAKTSEKVLAGFAAAAQHGYMTMAEVKNVLEDTLDLIQDLGAYGDKAFTGLARGLTVMRELLNNMGFPNWEQVYDKYKELLKNFGDFTNTQAQITLALTAKYMKKSTAQVQQMLMTDADQVMIAMQRAHWETTKGLLSGFTDLTKVTQQQLFAIKQQAEAMGIPAETVTNLYGRARLLVEKYGISTQEALQRVVKEWEHEQDIMQKRLKSQKEFQQVLGDFQSQLSYLTGALTDIGHAIMVFFGKPLLWVATMALKPLVLLIKTLALAFGAIQERLHGLPSYVIALTVALVTLKKTLAAIAETGIFHALVGSTKAIEDSSQQIGRLGQAIVNLRKKYPILDELAEKAGLPGLTAARSLEEFKKKVPRAYSIIEKLFFKIVALNNKLTEIMTTAATRALTGVQTLAARLLPVITNPYFAIAAAVVAGLYFFGKYEDQVLAFIQNLPKKVQDFVEKSFLPAMQDIFSVLPDLVTALVKAFAVAIQTLPDIIYKLAPALFTAAVATVKAVGVAMAKGLVENFWGTLGTILIAGALFLKAIKKFDVVAGMLRSRLDKALARGMETSLYKYLESTASELMGSLQKPLDAIKSRIQSAFTDAGATLGDVFKSQAQKASSYMSTFFVSFKGGFAKMLAMIKGSSIFQILASQFAALIPVVQGALATVASMLNPAVLIGAALVVGLALLYKYRKKIIEWAKSIGAWLKDLAIKIAKFAFEVFKWTLLGLYLRMVRFVVKETVKAFTWLAGAVKKAVIAVMDFIKDAIAWAIKWSPIGIIVRLVIAHVDAIKKVVSNIKGFLLKTFSSIADKIWSVFKWTPFGLWFRAIKALITKAKSWISSLLSWLSAPFEAIGDKFGGLVDIVSGIKDKIMKVVGPLVKVATFFKNIWDKITGKSKKAETSAKKATEGTKLTQAQIIKQYVSERQNMPVRQLSPALASYRLQVASAQTVARPALTLQGLPTLSAVPAQVVQPTQVAVSSQFGPIRRIGEEGVVAASLRRAALQVPQTTLLPPVATPAVMTTAPTYARPTQVKGEAPVSEVGALADIAGNTEVMVMLLRRIEANTRKGSKAPEAMIAQPPRAIKGTDEELRLLKQGYI